MLAAVLLAAAFFTPPLAPPSPDAVLAKIAELVLRARLKEASLVQVTVDGGTSDLLEGTAEVGSVSVSGRGWCTPLQLSCRSLQLTVGQTAVDLKELLGRQQITLLRPAIGSATMHFTAADWDRLLQHQNFAAAMQARRRAVPLSVRKLAFGRGTVLRPPGRRRAAEGVRGGTGDIEFPVCLDDAWHDVTLFQSASGEALAECRPREEPARAESEAGAVAGEAGAVAGEAARWIGSFFDELVLDLDGVELRFSELRVLDGEGRGSEPAATAGARGREPQVQLDLSVCVRRCPSPLEINF